MYYWVIVLINWMDKKIRSLKKRCCDVLLGDNDDNKNVAPKASELCEDLKVLVVHEHVKRVRRKICDDTRDDLYGFPIDHNGLHAICENKRHVAMNILHYERQLRLWQRRSSFYVVDLVVYYLKQEPNFEHNYPNITDTNYIFYYPKFRKYN